MQCTPPLNKNLEGSKYRSGASSGLVQVPVWCKYRSGPSTGLVQVPVWSKYRSGPSTGLVQVPVWSKYRSVHVNKGLILSYWELITTPQVPVRSSVTVPVGLFVKPLKYYTKTQYLSWIQIFPIIHNEQNVNVTNFVRYNNDELKRVLRSTQLRKVT